MTATPTYHVFVAGEVATAANINSFGTVLAFLKQPPILQVRQTVAQSIANGIGAGTALTFTTEDVDSSGMHSNSSNTSRATAVYPGWYRFSGGAGFAANATGARGGYAAVNGTLLNGTSTVLPATAAGVGVVALRSVLVFLNAADYFEWLAVQSSGAALNTSVGGSEQPGMTATWESD